MKTGVARFVSFCLQVALKYASAFNLFRSFKLVQKFLKHSGLLFSAGHRDALFLDL
jgi:hypothetical protein